MRLGVASGGLRVEVRKMRLVTTWKGIRAGATWLHVEGNVGVVVECLSE